MVTVQVGEQSIIARLPPGFTGRRKEPIFLVVDPVGVSLFDPGSEHASNSRAQFQLNRYFGAKPRIASSATAAISAVLAENA